MEKDKCCGECCWFCFEDADGFGFCEHKETTDDGYCQRCDGHACKDYVSREEMRHYMAVLLQAKRWSGNQLTVVKPDTKDFLEAIDFAYKFFKVFSEL